ncbi:putative Diacylglyceryl transferase [Hyella patelloides LEGE 07179]|uniref:Putative Diacylglyceryl transferase n=1 Tax=Hyella patelloides LEGE 07179 TaxID=945734 RepID=A0A563VLJ5_9CYAN|nr:hypothetical protein [Hyella patelloides]VEP12203.1 putative Diacylglyceryl transferase [Hyella patelloides LEGE 07179]
MTKVQELLQDFVTKNIDIQGVLIAGSQENHPIYDFFCNESKNNNKEILVNFFPLIDHFQRDLTIGKVERIIIEGEKGYCVLVGCQKSSILLVLADKELVKGWLFLKIKELVKGINTLVIAD